MDPKNLSALDPKLKTAYDRVMGMASPATPGSMPQSPATSPAPPIGSPLSTSTPHAQTGTVVPPLTSSTPPAPSQTPVSPVTPLTPPSSLNSSSPLSMGTPLATSSSVPPPANGLSTPSPNTPPASSPPPVANASTPPGFGTSAKPITPPTPLPPTGTITPPPPPSPFGNSTPPSGATTSLQPSLTRPTSTLHAATTTPHIASPVKEEKSGGMKGILLFVVALIFFAIYAVLWMKLLNYPLPF